MSFAAASMIRVRVASHLVVYKRGFVRLLDATLEFYQEWT